MRFMKGLTTQTKLRIARVLSRFVIGVRKCFGKPSIDIFKRKGIYWELDLNEGIDLSIYLFGRFEYDVYNAYKHVVTEGCVVLDLGANVGAHTLPIASLAGETGRVHAFEPTVFAIEKLKKNLGLNSQLSERVAVHHVLLSDSAETVGEIESIPSSWNLSVAIETSHPQHGGSFMGLGDAQTCTLDSVVKSIGIKKIDLIKLDVDGNEWSILSGGTHTFDLYRPDVLMEFAPDYNLKDFEQILGFFKARGYRTYSMRSGEELPDGLQELRRHIPMDGSINVKLSTQLIKVE